MAQQPLPWSIYDSISAVEVPPGQISNLMNPDSQAPALIAVNAVALALMLPVVLSRLWIRGRISRNLGWDDYACGMAAVASIFHSSLILYDINLNLGVHLWNIPISFFMDPSNIRFLTGVSLIYPVAACLVKISILLLYRRSYPEDLLLQRIISIAVICIGAIYTVYTCLQTVVFVQCTSSASISQQPICQNIFTINVLQSSINLVSNLLILLMLVGHHIYLPRERRLRHKLLIILSFGSAVCIISIIRTAILLNTVRLNDLWNSATIANFSVVEINMEIIAACLPILLHLIKQKDVFRFLPPWTGHSSSSTLNEEAYKSLRAPESLG